jgi:hypothetical protein
MAQKPYNHRPHDLSHIQPGTKDYAPANDGYEKEIVEQSSRITVGVTDGKSGSVTGVPVSKEAKPNMDKSNNAFHYE